MAAIAHPRLSVTTAAAHMVAANRPEIVTDFVTTTCPARVCDPASQASNSPGANHERGSLPRTPTLVRKPQGGLPSVEELTATQLVRTTELRDGDRQLPAPAGAGQQDAGPATGDIQASQGRHRGPRSQGCQWSTTPGRRTGPARIPPVGSGPPRRPADPRSEAGSPSWPWPYRAR